MAISIVPNDPVGEAVELIVGICKDLYEAAPSNVTFAQFMTYKDFYGLLPNAIEIWKETRHGF